MTAKKKKPTGLALELASSVAIDGAGGVEPIVKVLVRAPGGEVIAGGTLSADRAAELGLAAEAKKARAQAAARIDDDGKPLPPVKEK